MVIVIQRDDGEYYMGSTYVHHGECFAATGRLEEAKTYKSKAIAERSRKALDSKCEGIWEVVEIDEKGVQIKG